MRKAINRISIWMENKKNGFEILSERQYKRYSNRYPNPVVIELSAE